MLYNDPLRYWPQWAAAMGMLVGGVTGMRAALDTGDPFRYLGTALFVAITLPLYAWQFHRKTNS